MTYQKGDDLMIQAISAIKDFEGQRLAGVDRVRQRITEIESKFGINGVGQDFQNILNQEIQKAQRTRKIAPVDKTNNTESVKSTSNTDVNKVLETFEADENSNSTNKAATLQTSPIQSTLNNPSSERVFPGEEALPDALRSSINPSSAISSRPEVRNDVPKVEEEEVETPTYETKRLSTESVKAGTEELLLSASEKYNVDPRLSKAVAIVESNMNQNDISDAGAIGVMQLMPETARSLGVDPYDEEQNIDGGVRFLGQMLKTFNGDVKKAVAAYNAGPGAVQKYGGIPPYRETQAYVGRVMDLYR